MSLCARLLELNFRTAYKRYTHTFVLLLHPYISYFLKNTFFQIFEITMQKRNSYSLNTQTAVEPIANNISKLENSRNFD